MSDPAKLTVPATMRAWVITKSGYVPKDILQLRSDYPALPEPTGNEVLVRVAYAGPTIANMFTARFPNFLRAKDAIPCGDFSGIVVSLGPKTSGHLIVGTRVFGILSREQTSKGRGTLAEWVLVKEDDAGFGVVPENISLQEATPLASAGNTTIRMCQRAGLKGGERVLVNGASGGVGSVLVQVLKNWGVKEIIAVCSSKNAEFVRSLGADEVLDYTTNPIEEQLAERYGENQFDCVMDTVGIQALVKCSPSFLKEDGVFVNVGSLHDGVRAGLWNWVINSFTAPRKYVMFSTPLEKESTEMAAKWASEGKLKAPIQQIFAFEKAAEAYDLILTLGVRGKLLVKVQEVEDGDVGVAAV